MSYICERCGKITEEKFGSGRFCSRACANTRERPVEVREKIRAGVLKITKCSCKYCNQPFNNLTVKASHEFLCVANPNRRENPGAVKQREKKLARNVVLYNCKDGNTTLDITYNELEAYRKKQPVCEICGKSVEEITKWKDKKAVKNLCIDHDHSTKKFRGLLCQLCNRQLGWYENYASQVDNYLKKK